MSLLLAAPIFTPLLAAVLCLLLRERRSRHWIGAIAALSLLLSGVALIALVLREGIVVLQMGGWPAPFGIVLVADHLAALMVLLTGIIAVAGTGYHLAVERHDASDRGLFVPLLQLLLLGVCGAFLTGDLFNLYVWFEVMLMASFVLLAKSGGRDQAEAAVKYVAINLLASTMLLSAIGIIYGAVGTVNLADLARRIEAEGGAEASGVVAASVMLLLAFGVKSALFPLFFWLPASYHTTAVAVNAIFAGLLTKVGVYALIRLFTLPFPVGSGLAHPLLLWIGMATMIVGVLGALAQGEMRRILSFHIISQIGYMVLGIAFGSAFAIAAAIFYVGHNIVVKANLILTCGLAGRFGGSEDLQRSAGIAQGRPLLAALFLVPALSLAGIPPFSGFFAKLAVISSCLRQDAPLVAAVALGVGLLTLLSMLKIWNGAFAGAAPPGRDQPEQGGWQQLAPLAGLAAITVAVGLLAGPLFAYCLQAGEQLSARQGYVEAVLGGPGR